MSARLSEMMVSGSQSAGDRPQDNVAGGGDLARRLVDWCQLWEICGHTACRRARACRVAAVPCFDAHIATVFALLDEDAAFRRLLEMAEEAKGWIDG